MVSFNLYPAWRVAEQAYRNKIVKRVFSLAVILPLLLLLSLHFYLQQTQSQLSEQVNSWMEREEADQAVSSRSLPLGVNQLVLLQKLLLALSQSPDGQVCLLAMHDTPEAISFSGTARTVTDLNNYLRKWQAATLFSHVEIKQIQEQSDGRVHFSFQGVQVP